MTTFRRLVLPVAVLVVALALAGSGSGGTSTPPIVTAVSDSYFFHNCALVDDGRAMCWGFGISGALGDGTGVDRRTPVPVVGLPSGLREIVTGGSFSCALDSGGGVWCWGRPPGQGTDYYTPIRVQGLAAGVKDISGGRGHACALTDGGGVKCWGDDRHGQLGDGLSGEGAFSETPVWVVGLESGVEAIAAGGSQTCALLTNRSVKCWGQGGLVGDGTNTDRSTPVLLDNLSNVSSIAAGEVDTCAVTDAGGAFCWGSNAYGQIGDGTTTARLSPTAVSGLDGEVRTITVGDTIGLDDAHACALLQDGGIDCWGDNYYGQLGDGTQIDRRTPVPVTQVGGAASAVSAGAGRTCALVSGRLICWGSNYSAWLGVGPDFHTSPVDTLGVKSGAASVGAGTWTSCAVTTAGEVECWGQEFVWPSAVTGFEGPVETVASGAFHNCAVLKSGGAECWGAGDSGQLGDGTGGGSGTPVQVFGLQSGVVQVSAGRAHSCAVTSAGALKCWGANIRGQLGAPSADECSGYFGSFPCSWKPLAVTGLSSGVKEVAAGRDHTCALSAAGGVECWGLNDGGQLGNGTRANSDVPVDVAGLTSGVIAISAGSEDSCAALEAGGVECWGNNQTGQLGDGTTTNSLVPVKVVNLSDRVVELSSGKDSGFTCALTDVGGVKCWGDNQAGEDGNGNTRNPLSAVGVLGLSSGVKALSAGGAHTCAVTAAGAVKCWGADALEQLGDGKGGVFLQPSNVLFLPPPTPKTLTIQIKGPGTVLTKPAGIQCPSTCTHAFLDGITVQVFALPDKGAAFAGWSGDCGTNPECDLTMTQNTAITARFETTCTVPWVIGKRLSVARTALKRAHCSVGKVRRAHSRRFRKGHVVFQRPGSDTVLRQGGKVNLTVSRGRRHH